MSARATVLDAFERILSEDGERAATLDAVAAAASVSKGGLLYHFPSKDALVAGLVERLRELVNLDLEAMRAASEGPSRYYVSSSVSDGSPLDRALVAVARLALGADPAARAALLETRLAWLGAISEEVPDPAVAAAILCIGDGQYYSTLLTGQSDPDVEVVDPTLPDVDALLAVIDRMRAGA